LIWQHRFSYGVLIEGIEFILLIEVWVQGIYETIMFIITKNWIWRRWRRTFTLSHQECLFFILQMIF